MVLSHHYRMPVDYNEEIVSQIERNLENISMFLAKIDFRLDFFKKGVVDIGLPKVSPVFAYPALFKSKLADDLNTPAAIALLFQAIGKTNEKLGFLNENSLIETRNFIKESLDTLGITLKKPKIPLKIKRLAAEREKFRRNKQFIQSDVLRKKIDSLGYIVEDTPMGPFLWPKVSTND